MSMTLSPLSNSIWALPPLGDAGRGAVAQTADAWLVQDAVSLSSEASVVAQLGMPNVDLPLYNAAGLLNQLVQSDTAPAVIPTPTAGSDITSLSQQLMDSAIVDTLLPLTPSMQACIACIRSLAPCKTLA